MTRLMRTLMTRAGPRPFLMFVQYLMTREFRGFSSPLKDPGGRLAPMAKRARTVARAAASTLRNEAEDDGGRVGKGASSAPVRHLGPLGGGRTFVTPTQTNVHEDALCFLSWDLLYFKDWRLAVGGGWQRLAVGGWWSLGAVLNQRKIRLHKDRHATPPK